MWYLMVLFRFSYKRRTELLLLSLALTVTLSLWLNSVAWCTEESAMQFEDRLLSSAKRKKPDLIDGLSSISRLPINEAINVIINLTDYYFGELPAEMLSENATRIGEKILPFLVEKRHTELRCMEKHRDLCVKDIQTRNRLIESMMEAINKGLILYVEFPENLKVEADQNLRIIGIFLEDYRRAQSRYPSTLGLLREYAWNRYGYKLKIYNPWGRPFKYTLSQENRYLIEFGEEHP